MAYFHCWSRYWLPAPARQRVAKGVQYMAALPPLQRAEIRAAAGSQRTDLLLQTQPWFCAQVHGRRCRNHTTNCSLTLRPSTLAGVAVTARKTSSSDIPAAVSFDITCEGTNNPHDFSHIHLIEKPAGLGILWMLLPYRRQVVWWLARWDLSIC